VAKIKCRQEENHNHAARSRALAPNALNYIYCRDPNANPIEIANTMM